MGVNAIIGSILTPSARYVEHWESGSFNDEIDSDGVRTRTVSKILTCYKAETRTVASSLSVYPDELHTTGGKNPDGSWAESVNWGAGFTLTDISFSEITPSLSKVTGQYQADDPVGGDGVAPAGMAGGCIIGKPWEGGNRYIETPASGKMRLDRTYLANSFGWNRVKNVDRDLMCLKTDSRQVADSFTLEPDSLSTNPYNDTAIAWGENYRLISMSGQSVTPSMFQITAKYRRNIAEAIYAPPDGIDLRCVNGICEIRWQDVLFEQLDSYNTVNLNGIDVELDADDPYMIHMTCQGMIMASSKPSVETGDKILRWNVDGTHAQLLWCEEIWKDYMVGS